MRLTERLAAAVEAARNPDELNQAATALLRAARRVGETPLSRVRRAEARRKAKRRAAARGRGGER